MLTILLTGVGGPAGQSLARLLIHRGYQVIGVDMREVEPDGYSFGLVPPARDPLFLPRLQEIAQFHQVGLLIPTVTEELPVIAEGWQCCSAIPSVGSSLKAVQIANDKYLTMQCLSASEVPVPRYALPSEVHSAEEVEYRIGWPCISKPRQGRGGRGVALRIRADWPALAALGDDQILQEFAPGIDYAPNVFIGTGTFQSFAVVLEKTELKEGIVGNARSVRRIDDPQCRDDIAAVAIAAAKAAGLVGPQDVDIRRLPDGRPVVLEINARFGANIASAPEVLDATLKSFGV